MKQKKPTPSKPKLSFTVDRSEFDISSDWVQAVMRPPSLPGPPAPFFSPDRHNATGVSSATDEQNSPVVQNTPDEHNTGVAEQRSVEKNAIPIAANSTPVVESATVATAPEPLPAPNATGAHNATAVDIATGSYIATVTQNAPRAWKLRHLRRITDGLTPGQYAVYSLMFENSDTVEGRERLYRGGYADIGRLTGLSKRGIQNVIGELQEKQVIRLQTAPGHHRLQTSVYTVPNPEAILAAWLARGWRYATGKSKQLTDGTTVALLATDGSPRGLPLRRQALTLP